MDSHTNDPSLNTEDLEHKALELVNLMFALCEERIRGISAMPDAPASPLSSAAMAVRDAIQTFLTLERIR